MSHIFEYCLLQTATGGTERMTTTMTTRTATRAASAAVLTLSAMLALSACGGADDAKAGSQSEGVGDNAQVQGVYVDPGDGETILAIHGKDIALISYGGETCDDFTAFFDKAEAGEFDAFDNEGDNPDHLGTIERGTLNDTQSQMIFPADTGNDPKTVSVNSPDSGFITVGNDGDYYVPKDSDEGKQAYDIWKNAQCG